MAKSPTTEDVEDLVDALSRVLAGKDPTVQGAALADLLSMWVAGHVVIGDRKATRAMRLELLQNHMQAVEELIEVNAKQLGTS